MARKRKSKKRWHVLITYLGGNHGESLDIEELSELHDIIERGPDWNLIESIEIQLNRRSL